MNTDHLSRCIQTVDSSVAFLQQTPAGSIEFEVYRNAVVKGFELTLEVVGKLLRRAVKSYGARPREVDALSYKDVLRHALKHGLLESEAVPAGSPIAKIETIPRTIMGLPSRKRHSCSCRPLSPMPERWRKSCRRTFMSAKLDLKPRHAEIVRRILGAHVPEV